ncbi:hypothetical protein [Winogradskyella sp.]|uniref:hypothetical protein n=1 Tax=Winogradskyella sp. TaxID=1883156 RepID=UPI003BAD23A8
MKQDTVVKTAERTPASHDYNFQSVYMATMANELDLGMSDKEIDNMITYSKVLDSLQHTANWGIPTSSGYKIQPHSANDIAITLNAMAGIDDCWTSRPKSIKDLTDGVLIDAYSFVRGDEKKLGLLGFFNTTIEKGKKSS